MKFDLRDSFNPGLRGELGPVLRGDPGISAPLATLAEAEAGTLEDVRSWTPALIRAAIEALSTGGGSMLPPIGSHVRLQSSLRMLDYEGMTLLHSGHFEATADWPDYPVDVLGGQVALKWSNVNVGIGTSSSRFGMADNGVAIMVSTDSSGSASISRNFGKTWQVLTLPGTGSLYGVWTDGKGTWILCGSYTRALLRSTDDGETWTEVPHGYTGGSIYAVVPDGNGTWIMSNTNTGQIRKSTDNALTWVDVGSNGGGLYGGATDGNGTWVFCGGGGRIARSINNGDTWTSGTPLSDTSSACYSMAYADGVWLVGNSAGRIFRSADGISWVLVAQVSTGVVYQFANDGNGHWRVAQSSSTLACSDDGGINWYMGAWPFGSGSTSAYGCTWAGGAWLLSASGGQVMRSEDDAWIGIAGHEEGLYLRIA